MAAVIAKDMPTDTAVMLFYVDIRHVLTHNKQKTLTLRLTNVNSDIQVVQAGASGSGIHLSPLS